MKNLLLLSFLSISLLSNAQVFSVDTIQYKGADDNRIVLAFVGDGYTNAQQQQYITNVTSMVDEIFNKSPFKEYRDFFNVYAISVPSNVTGAALSPNNLIDNYFGSTFGYSGIDRLLVPTKSGAVYSVLNANVPNYDQAFVIVNSTKYGGSGGSLATSSINGSSGEVAIHEIGHSFANLADEYWFRAQEKPNQTSDGNTVTNKWKDWIGVDGVGIYPHAESPTQFRPHQSCEMRYLNNDFCVVCREAFIEEYYHLVSNLDGYQPNSTSVDVGNEAVFRLELLVPSPNTVTVDWILNGVSVATDVDSIVLTDYPLNNNNTLVANILDETGFTKKVDHSVNNTSTVEWSVSNLITGINIEEVNQYDTRFMVYPNPTNGPFEVKFESSYKGEVSLYLMDLEGRELLYKEISSLGTRQTIGFDPANLELEDGLYMLNVQMGDNVMMRKIVVQK